MPLFEACRQQPFPANSAPRAQLALFCPLCEDVLNAPALEAGAGARSGTTKLF